MNPKQAMKNRMPISQVKGEAINFLKSEKRIQIGLNDNSDFPVLDIAEYRYIGDEQILVLTRMSRFLNQNMNESKISANIYESNDVSLKMSKRVYGKYVCKELLIDDSRLIELSKTDEFVKKMLNHGAKFFKLELIEAIFYVNSGEIFALDKNFDATFSNFTLSGKERFENSRHILMNYNDKDVIFNTIIENGVYYTLTKADSNKISYITNGGICKIYDGKENHFETRINILEDDMVLEIFEKLNKTNNGYFKVADNLKALSFSKQ